MEKKWILVNRIVSVENSTKRKSAQISIAINDDIAQDFMDMIIWQNKMSTTEPPITCPMITYNKSEKEAQDDK